MKALTLDSTKIDEAINYLLEEIKHNPLMSENYKKVCRTLNYFEHLVYLVLDVFQFLHFIRIKNSCNNCRN